MPIILVLERQRQEDQEFRTSSSEFKGSLGFLGFKKKKRREGKGGKSKGRKERDKEGEREDGMT